MNYTAFDLVGGCTAFVLLGLILLATGYLPARLLLSVLPSHRLGRPVSFLFTLLWTICLAIPACLTLTGIVGHVLPFNALVLVLACLPFASAGLVYHSWSGLRHRSRSLPPPPQRFRATWLRRERPSHLGLALLALGVYLLLAGASLQVGPHLYEPVSVADWSVRVPLVADSVRNGVPPRNPFFTAAGVEQPARYYFFWYSLCAAVARMAHLPARAALAGSVVWSALALVSLLFLALRYLVGIRARLRQHGLLALGLCCVLGIDLVPTLGGLLTRPIHLTPEIEWWHDDRIPSFLGAFLFAPHHIAGLVCAVLGITLLTLLPFRTASPSLPHHADSGAAPDVLAAERTARGLAASKGSLPRTLVAIGLAGLCFAATAGTSTYIALCFGFVGAICGVQLLLQRRWVDTLALLAAGLVAVALTLPFLHSILASPAGSTPPSPAHAHLFRLTLRDLHDGDRVVTFVSKRLHHRVTYRPLLHLLALPLVALSLPLEFGFFVVPLAMKLRQDFRRLRARDRFTDGERALWAIFLGAAVPALFLSSEPTQGVNDLGRHAGLILRFVVIVWSTPLLLPYAERLLRRQPLLPATAGRSAVWTLRLATVLLVLGLAGEAWQVVADRVYLIVFDRTHRNPEMPFAKDHDLAERYLDLRRGLDQVEAGLPPSAVVQSNMGSRYQLPVMLYSHRPFAAGDPSCEIAFGGNPARCAPAVFQLQRLFGGPSDVQPAPLGPYVTVTAPDAAQTTTLDAFRTACQDLRLAAVVAQNSDPAWSIPGSWVWGQTPRFATPRVRIFLCPALPPSA